MTPTAFLLVFALCALVAALPVWWVGLFVMANGMHPVTRTVVVAGVLLSVAIGYLVASVLQTTAWLLPFIWVALT